MFMSPSCIHHMTSDKDNILCSVDIQNIIDVSKKICQNGDLPKIQVVEKDGYWFTLNNSQLDLCRRLESDGKFAKVRVDVVSLSEVPCNVRRMMVVPPKGAPVSPPPPAEADSQSPPPKCRDKESIGGSDQSRTTSKGYQKLGQGDPDEEKERGTDSDAESGSDSSEFAESDSECDWSEDDQESSEGESTDGESGSGSQSSDDERECLL